MNLYQSEIETIHSVNIKSFIDGLRAANFPIGYRESYDHINKKIIFHVIFNCLCYNKLTENLEKLPMFEITIYGNNNIDNAFMVKADTIDKELIVKNTRIEYSNVENLVDKFNKQVGSNYFNYRNLFECVEALRYIIIYTLFILRKTNIIETPCFNSEIESKLKGEDEIGKFDRDGWFKKLIQEEINKEEEITG